MSDHDSEKFEIRPRKFKSMLWLCLYLAGFLYFAGVVATELNLLPRYSIFSDAEAELPKWVLVLISSFLLPLFGWGALSAWNSSLGAVIATLTKDGARAPSGKFYC